MKVNSFNNNIVIILLFITFFSHIIVNLFILEMIEATGLGWEGRNQMAKLIANYIKSKETNPATASKMSKLIKSKMPDLRGGINK